MYNLQCKIINTTKSGAVLQHLVTNVPQNKQGGTICLIKI